MLLVSYCDLVVCWLVFNVPIYMLFGTDSTSFSLSVYTVVSMFELIYILVYHSKMEKVLK